MLSWKIFCIAVVEAIFGATASVLYRTAPFSSTIVLWNVWQRLLFNLLTHIWTAQYELDLRIFVVSEAFAGTNGGFILYLNALLHYYYDNYYTFFSNFFFYYYYCIVLLLQIVLPLLLYCSNRVFYLRMFNVHLLLRNHVGSKVSYNCERIGGIVQICLRICVYMVRSRTWISTLIELLC